MNDDLDGIVAAPERQTRSGRSSPLGRWVGALVGLLVLASACSGASPSPSSTIASKQPGASLAPSETATPVPTPADLLERPLVWFAPLPPLPTGPGRPYTGSDDFMALFEAEAPWASAAARIDVFKLYGEWVDFTDSASLATAVTVIRERGMAVAVEAGPLDPAGCGVGVEGFAGSDSGRRLAQRIRAAGGTLQVIALDEPWYFAHVYDGPNACHWPVEQVAQGVADFVEAVRAEFPWVVVGDIEPTPTPVSAPGLAEWMAAYEAAVGEPMAFLHLDPDWSKPDWSSLAVAVEAAGAQRGVPVGMLYNGGGAPTDERWLQLAGQHALDHEDRDGGNPDHVVFQSWNDHPDLVLPETDADSFTALVNRYFDDRASLGLGGPGGNLAWQRPVTASSALADAPAANAVDGDSDTNWNAGADPPAWIEVDLGSATLLSEIRLTASQFPAGAAQHRAWGRVAPGGKLVLLGTLSGETTDYQILTLTSPGTWPAVRFVRVETVSSPSWVAWREIEVEGPPS